MTVAAERELYSVPTFNTLSYYQPVQEELKQIWFKLLTDENFLIRFSQILCNFRILRPYPTLKWFLKEKDGRKRKPRKKE